VGMVWCMYAWCTSRAYRRCTAPTAGKLVTGDTVTSPHSTQTTHAHIGPTLYKCNNQRSAQSSPNP
jgi:hypothetical protein